MGTASGGLFDGAAGQSSEKQALAEDDEDDGGDEDDRGSGEDDGRAGRLGRHQLGEADLDGAIDR